MLDDLRFDNFEARRRLCREIDFDDLTAKRLWWRERIERLIDPLRGRACKVEIAIEALDRAFAAERGKARVDCLADGAELRISGVAERQHSELDAIKGRSSRAHQLRIGARGARGRLTLAPGS